MYRIKIALIGLRKRLLLRSALRTVVAKFLSISLVNHANLVW